MLAHLKITIYFLKPMVLSNLKLHFTTTRSSTSSGFNLALLGVTTLPDERHPLRFRWSSWHWKDHLDELGNIKLGLRLMMPPKFSWSTEDKSSGNTHSCSVLSGGFTRLWCSLGKPWTKAEPEMMNIYQQMMICGRHLWLGCTCTEDTLQCAIKIVSKVSPNFGCLFLWNNTVLLDGRHGCRMKRWICTDYISILSQHYLNSKTFTF